MLSDELKRECWCETCRPMSMSDMRFVVCPDCGNKRCPKATDHRNACTGSNEPGQPGSSYAGNLPEAKREASQEPVGVSAPGMESAAFEEWYVTEFKPAMERGPLDIYVARQAWFASRRAAHVPCASDPVGSVYRNHNEEFEILDYSNDQHPIGTHVDVYTSPQPCSKCAELEQEINRLTYLVQCPDPGADEPVICASCKAIGAAYKIGKEQFPAHERDRFLLDVQHLKSKLAEAERQRDELIGAIKVADDALSAGDNNKALTQIRVAASIASTSYQEYLAKHSRDEELLKQCEEALDVVKGSGWLRYGSWGPSNSQKTVLDALAALKERNKG